MINQQDFYGIFGRFYGMQLNGA